MQLLKDPFPQDKIIYPRMAAVRRGVSEETSTGVHRLTKMADQGALHFPAINVNNCVNNFGFDYVYGCRHSLPDGIMREADVMIVGKSFLIRGYGDVSKGSAFAVCGAGSRVLITKIDLICTLQVCMGSLQVVRMKIVGGKPDGITTEEAVVGGGPPGLLASAGSSPAESKSPWPAAGRQADKDENPT